MKKITYLAKSLAVAALLLSASGVNAQMELKVLTQGETRFNDVNDFGFGVTVYHYYNFETNETIPIEPEVFMVHSTNNDENIAGTMFYDVEDMIFEAAYKKEGIWHPIGFLEGQDPYDGDENTVYGISENSKYITGQSNIGYNYGGFLYDTETEEMIGTFDPEGESSSSYNVNDNGIMVGWVDRPDDFGTLRVPAYRTLDGEYHLIPEGQLPVLSSDNTIQHINNNNVMVGDFDLRPFIYDMESDTFTSFDLPQGADHAAFAMISENGVAVGFADVDFQVRDAIIYHPSLGDEVLYLKDVLADNGITVDTEDGLLGTALAISPNGKYIAGWVNGAPQYAEGWMLYLDDLILGTPDVSDNAISSYPNPVRDILHLTSKENINSVEIYTMTGQQVSSNTTNDSNTEIDLSELSSGIYVVKMATDNGIKNLKVIKE